MKKTKMRGLPDTILHQILGEYHQVLNQHAQVMNQQRNRIAALHHRLQVVEAAAGILPEGAALPVIEGEVEVTDTLTQHEELPEDTPRACCGEYSQCLMNCVERGGDGVQTRLPEPDEDQPAA